MLKLGSGWADERGHHVEHFGMTDDKNDDLSDVDRRSIRILARSTKAAGPANARIAERLEKAAGSGTRTDYQRAEESFDSLPPRERRRIGTHAERQAETERELSSARKQRPPVPKVSKPTVDDTLDWKPMILDHSPATDDPAPLSWKPIPPEKEASAKPLPSVPRPAASKPTGASGRVPGKAASASGKAASASGKPAQAATAPKRPTIALDPVADGPPEDGDKGWDWQRIPEDPVLKATRKKSAAADPIEELRRQMLGDDLKRR